MVAQDQENVHRRPAIFLPSLPLSLSLSLSPSLPICETELLTPRQEGVWVGVLLRLPVREHPRQLWSLALHVHLHPLLTHTHTDTTIKEEKISQSQSLRETPSE